MNTPDQNPEKAVNPVDPGGSKTADAPIPCGFAGVLMIFAGPASLGLTTTDPTNPSGLAILTMFLAFGSAAYSFKGKRSRALVCTRTFVVVTGLCAFIGTVNPKFTGNILVYPIGFIFCGGAGCLLGLWALLNLRTATPAV
jgi:hypothetical protein